jgi:hypothetical protein
MEAPRERVVPYTDGLFRDATVQWLIETHQVCLLYFYLLSIFDKYFTADPSSRAPSLQGDDCYSRLFDSWRCDSKSKGHSHIYYQIIQEKPYKFTGTNQCKCSLLTYHIIAHPLLRNGRLVLCPWPVMRGKQAIKMPISPSQVIGTRKFH